MRTAIVKVLSKQLSIRDAAIQYNVPKSTLARRTGSKNKIALGSLKHLGRFTTDLPADFELELKQHILDMESRFFWIHVSGCEEVSFSVGRTEWYSSQIQHRETYGRKEMAVRFFEKKHRNFYP